MLPEATTPSTGPTSWTERAWLVLSAAVPGLVAVGQLELDASGGRDAALVRTVGLGSTGGFRALDAWLAALFAWVPLGTRTLRAELSGVFLLASTAALGFVLIRRCLVAVKGPTAWSSAVAAIATAGATLSGPFQHEAGAPGSALAGVVLVLLALVSSGRAPADAALLTLGATYDAPVGLCVLAVVGVRRLLRRTKPLPAPSHRFASGIAVALAGVGGLVPFALAVARARVTRLSTSAPAFSAPFGEGLQGGGGRSAIAAVAGVIGEPAALFAVVGLAWALWSRKAWRAVLPLAAALTISGVTLLSGGGSGRDAWGAPGLVLVLTLAAFLGVTMQEAVVRVARARVPLAAASAAMVVLLAAAFPAVQLDDGLARAAKRTKHALSTWEDAAFAELPGAALTIVGSPRLYARLLASEASGALPGDLRIVPTFDPTNEAEAAAVARDPRLLPLFRDVALIGVPEELSLSTIAAQRPLAMAADPQWDRNLTRHLVPRGLLAVFEPEPRGGADRKRALTDSQPWRTRLASSLGASPEPTLVMLTASILFDRAVAAAETGEREVAMHAIQDASTFAPKDPRIQELTLREVSSRGSIDVRDLARQGLAAPLP